MSRLAVRVAAAGAIALAIVAVAAGLPPLVCTMRAAAGGAALWALTTVAGRLAAAITSAPHGSPKQGPLS
jgi:preprotein translocase subunit SecY